MSVANRLCKLHPDFHIPPDAVVGEGFDGDAYVRRCKEAGSDSVVFFAKCHYGFAYYPTRVGTVHPGLKMDMLGEFARGCRKHGVEPIAYYSLFVDSAAAQAHPEWRSKLPGAPSHEGFDSGNFQRVCVNSPYIDELLIPQALEVVRNYDVDELFFDTMTGNYQCSCDNCARAYGRALPTSASDPDWTAYCRWLEARYRNAFERITDAVRKVASKVEVVFNWKWGYREPEAPPNGVRHLAADLIPTGTVASTVSRYLAGTGLPCEYMCGRFLHGLGDWTPHVAPSLKYTAAATVANGAGFYLIDRQLPDGSLDERAYAGIREVFEFLQARREALTNIVPVAEVVVLYSMDSCVGPDRRYFANDKVRGERIAPFEGVSRLFREHGRHYTPLSAAALSRRIREFRLVILPDTEFVEPEVLAQLRPFVEAGGRLLITQSEGATPLDPALADLAGVDIHGAHDLSYGYFESASVGAVAVETRIAQVAPRAGAESLIKYLPPLRMGKNGQKFGHGFAPAGDFDGHSIAVSNRVGDGEVIYVALPAFTCHHRKHHPHVANLILSLMDRLLPDPHVRLATPALVENCVMRQGDDLIVNLVNHSGREALAGWWHPVLEFMPEIRDIEISIRDVKPGAEILAEPGRVPVAHSRAGNRTIVHCPPLEFLQSIRVVGHFRKG